MHLSVVIPAYNESKRLTYTLREVWDFLLNQNYKSELILVNDGSIDDTRIILESFAKDKSNIRVINNKINKGKGFSVKKGVFLSTGKYILFMDADSSTSITEVSNLFKYLKDKNGLVIGSRRLSESRIIEQRNIVRRFLGSFFSYIVDNFFSLEIEDPQNGFKLFTRESALKIFNYQTINRWAFDVEIILIARKFNFFIKEHPICWKNSSGSKMRVSGMFGMLSDLIKIKFNDLTGKYAD